MTEYKKEIEPVGEEVTTDSKKPEITEPIQPWGL